MIASASVSASPVAFKFRVEAAAEQARKPRVPDGLLGELLSRCCRRGWSHSCRGRVATREEIYGDPGGQSKEDEDDERHGLSGRLPNVHGG